MRSAIPRPVRRAVIERDGFVCTLCGVTVVITTDRTDPNRMHLDHIEYWAGGGEHHVENLRVTCAACNLSRPKPRAVIERRRTSTRPHCLICEGPTRNREALICPDCVQMARAR